MNQPSRRLRLLASLLFTVIAGLSMFGFAQENASRVGVAVMQNHAGRSVPGTLERDRLVQALNHAKPDKKTHLKVEAVPLNGSTGDEVAEEAEQKKCEYVVYTTLTELRGADDPYQHIPGTVETNPNSQWNPGGHPQAQRMDPEYRATVDYKLVKVGSNSVVSGAPFSTQQNGNEIDTVSQIMDRIALQVADQVKKGSPVMKE
jgi:hypothetical protein